MQNLLIDINQYFHERISDHWYDCISLSKWRQPLYCSQIVMRSNSFPSPCGNSFAPSPMDYGYEKRVHNPYDLSAIVNAGMCTAIFDSDRIALFFSSSCSILLE
ncbi:hypothetical protein CEXT_209241 [Caerostris extrusa]|uniref:Uncharacterized protein n=1 Tax=Caerostris extrusa TaxID=172846 RepID=A0AAV4P570_CAEEX|nr:hypothetical protein CEXT_209241 [Caerostris extrusa]